MVMIRRQYIPLVALTLCIFLLICCFFTELPVQDYGTIVRQSKTLSFNSIVKRVFYTPKHIPVIPPIHVKEIIEGFKLSNLCPKILDTDKICLWRYKMFYSKMNWKVMDIAVWKDPKSALPLFELAFKFAEKDKHFKIAKGLNPMAYAICKNVYKEKCSSAFLIDIDKHVRGVAQTKLPYTNGKFVPFKKNAIHNIFFALKTQLQMSYSIMQFNLEKMFIELFNFKRPITKFQTHALIMTSVHLFITIFIIIICKIIYWPLSYFWSYMGPPVFSFFILLVTHVFRPIRFFLHPFFLIITPLLCLLNSLKMGEKRKQLKKYVDFSMSTAVLPARSPNSLSKFMDKVDSAFMEHGLNEVTAPVSKVTQAYGLASDLQMKRMDIPYFSPSLIQSAFYQNTHIFIGARLSTLPESSGISFLNHIGFEEKEYYLVPPLCKEENLFAVGCSVYHVKSSCEKKNYIAHLYPRSYAGFITCWENDWDSSKGKALGSDNVIFTQNSIIHITRFYNCNLMTMADEMRDAFTLRPDWNQFKHEWFYWNFLYFTLPGLESSLLQKCVTGHVEIVFIESLGFRIRCIRRRSEQHEEDMKILKSYNKLFYALLNGIDDLSSRNFSNLFISIVNLLNTSTNQYKAITTAWWFCDIVYKEVQIAIKNGNTNDFSFDRINVPLIEDIYNYLRDVEMSCQNDPTGSSSKEVQVMEHVPLKKDMISNRNERFF